MELNTIIELARDLNIWTCLGLFVFYGVIFEILSVRYIVCLNKFWRWEASTWAVLLFVISLLGLKAAIDVNILYSIPIAIGTFLGNFIQITLEKKKSGKQGRDGEC